MVDETPQVRMNLTLQCHVLVHVLLIHGGQAGPHNKRRQLRCSDTNVLRHNTNKQRTTSHHSSLLQLIAFTQRRPACYS